MRHLTTKRHDLPRLVLLAAALFGCAGERPRDGADAAPPRDRAPAPHLDLHDHDAPITSDVSGPGAPPLVKPNLILIITDDQRAESIACMPKLQQHLAAAGVTFSRNFATTPLCCPGRSSVLTGKLAHNHGVLSNGDIEDGEPTKIVGAEVFRKRGNEAIVVARWLAEAGYATGFFGKYLNGYDDIAASDPRPPAPRVPPHWEEWRGTSRTKFSYFVLVERGPGAKGAQRVCYLPQHNDDALEEARCRKHADRVVDDRNENFLDDVLQDKLLDFVERQSRAGRPFFAYFAPKAPHGPHESARRYQPDPRKARFSDAALQRLAGCSYFDWTDRPPSFLEQDLTDKPEYVAAAAGKITRAEMDEVRRKQLVSVLPVDDAIEALVSTLQRLGQLERTVILFTSDNGFGWGDHWLPKKNCQYDGCSRVPLVVRHPRAPARGQTLDLFVENVDLAPTLLELAGVPLPAAVRFDGQSFAGLLDGRQTSWPRQEILTECWGYFAPGEPPRILAGVRTARWKYVELYRDEAQRVLHTRKDGRAEIELYDLQRDPHELDNLALLPEVARAKGYTDAELQAVLTDLRGRLARHKAR